MKFDLLDKMMREYEKSSDEYPPEGGFLIVRLDGRGFTRHTKETDNYEIPFDIRFHNHMLSTAEHLMNCGFNFVYGYTQSDEISLLFSPDDTAYGHKLRKLISVTAGEASACFSLLTQTLVSFDSRIIHLPDKDALKNYFAWRQEDCRRNAIDAHCYWVLRREGKDYLTATRMLEGKKYEYKTALLNSHGICCEKLPMWQLAGSELYYTSAEKEGYNPVTGEKVICIRRVLTSAENTITGENYGIHAAGMI